MNLLCYNQCAKVIVEDATNQLIKLNLRLSKFTRLGSYSEALSLFQRIHSYGNPIPDHYSLSAALTASAKLPNLRFGNQLHAHAIHTGLKAYPHVSNPLLSLYAKSEYLGAVKWVFHEMDAPDVYSWTTLLSSYTNLGQVLNACHLLNDMPLRNAAPWNAVITGCSENGYHNVVFDLFRRMHAMGVKHDNYTFASVLSSCSNEVVYIGRQVHSLIAKSGFLGWSSVTNSLLSMYFNCGNAMDSCKVFDEVDEMVHNEITYNAMINGLVSQERSAEALLMYKGMLCACMRPTHLTFLSLMSSGLVPIVCFQLHGWVIKMGYEFCTAVNNATMAMYANHGHLNMASKIFETLKDKDLVSWNTMIAGYAQNDDARSAISVFVEMRGKGMIPDEYTIGTLLGTSDSSEFIQMVYALVVKIGLSMLSEVMNAFVSAFSEQLEINDAYQIFCDLHVKNLITWNAIIFGFLINGYPLEGLDLFISMQKLKIKPDVSSLTTVLSICANISSLEHGKQVHGYILRNRFLFETSVGNGLITMYAKCGVINCSVKVFNSMHYKDVVSWNAIISAFAQYGEGEKAVQYFKVMDYDNGSRPDQATFTAVLSACSRGGLVCDGIYIFNSMVFDYGLRPGVNHFSCLVDLLGRAGYLDETEGLIKMEELKIDTNVLWTLFSACAAYSNVRLGRIVAGMLLQTEENDPAVYVLLSNIHANSGQWENAAQIRELMKGVGAVKQPGCSWIKT